MCLFCPRFDVKSKKSLKGEQKYYLADLGVYYSRNVDARINYGPVLENIVYTYLSAKNYKMSVGRIGKLECDFITRINDEYRYIQVAMTIMDPNQQEYCGDVDTRSTKEKKKYLPKYKTRRSD